MESCLLASSPGISNGTAGLLFMQMVQTLFVAESSLNLSSKYPADQTHVLRKKSNPKYDFIVVGGGSAGSVVASRLSENGSSSVLLVEAGYDPSPTSEIPGLAFNLQGTPEDWNYKCEASPNACLGGKDGVCKWAKGKALGGSSVINSLLYIYGNRKDFDGWADAGNEGWGYDDVLPYFKMSHNMEPGYIKKYGTANFGVDGPLPIRKFNNSNSAVQDIILEAINELGLSTLEAFTGDNQMGFGNAHGSVEYGRRMNVAKAFLIPAKDRKNLHVLKGARGDKVIIENDVATGVTVTLSNGKTVNIKAKKEVILSAGSIETPKILMLSGIGPRDHLEEMGICVVKDLPVGKNLQDHMMWLGLQLGFRNKSQIVGTHVNLDDTYDFLLDGKGNLASPGTADLVGFINVLDGTASYPNIQFHEMFVPMNSEGAISAIAGAIGLNEELTEDLRERSREHNLIVLLTTLLQPNSVGEVKLRSANPGDSVRIFNNYLNASSDVEVLLKTVDFVKSLVETEAFKKYGLTLQPSNIGACADFEFDSRKYWECNLRYLSNTQWHPVGTAKMGPAAEKSSVVDAKLRVHGITGLRVADASIMPKVTSANTNAASIMIGEKAAAMIKKQWFGA